MNNQNTIVTIGDSGYFLSMAISVMQAKRFHPECNFIVYDWGLKPGEKEFLILQGAKVVDWLNRFVCRPIPPAPARIGTTINSKAPLRTKLRLIRNVVSGCVKDGGKDREWLYAQKPYVLAHCSELIPSGTMVFLDGDAFLVAPIEEFFEDPCELKVTMRRKEEINFSFGFCQVINSGVLGITGTHETRSMIISEWISRMQGAFEFLVEQSALTRLVFPEPDPAALGQTRRIVTRSGEFKARLFECENYNYNWIEEGVDPEKNRILHFKGGRHMESNFLRLAKLIGLEKDLELAQKSRLGNTERH